ncbi:chorismate synthase [bacterium]|nr:chorismate synthase [bacterium]
MKFRFLTAGESHGKSLCAIIEGMVAGLDISTARINEDLKRRQQGKGRGGRMQIESDTVEILSGIRFSKTTGSPISMLIKNTDFENWKIPMSVEALNLNDPEISEKVKEKVITNVRPGHADLAGALKYGAEDIRDILERSSARETATRVAVGSVAKQFLEKFGVKTESKILSIGGIDAQNENAVDDIILQAKNKGDTLGGLIRVYAYNVVAGVGSFVNWDRKLDGNLARAIMSIGAVKSVEIGLGKECAVTVGSKMHDEIKLENGKIIRPTNNAGGIEGGMSNGEPIVVTLAMKPIPTMKTPLKSVNLNTKEAIEAHFERSDTCAVEACAVVAEAMTAIILCDEYLEKFGGDSVDETLTNFKNYSLKIGERLS